AKLVVEPAGAAAVAHLMDRSTGHGTEPAFDPDKPVVAVLSGGNIDTLLMLRIIRSGLGIAGRYLQFRVTVPDRPGSLSGLLALLAQERANVLEVQHGRTTATLQVDEVQISVTVETDSQEHSSHVV